VFSCQICRYRTFFLYSGRVFLSNMPVPYLFSLLGTCFLVKKYGTVPFFFILILILRYASCHLRAPRPLNYFFIFAEFFRHLACYDLSLFSVTFCIFFVLCSNNSLAAVAVQHKKSNRCTVFYLGCSKVPDPTHFL
jgi:hypothetical protein